MKFIAPLLLLAGVTSALAVTELDAISTNVSLTSHIESSGADVGSSLGGAEAKLRFFCNISHLNYDDPILNFGQPGAAHLHHFYGNTMTSAVSTYQTLRTTGDGTCAGRYANRTGYWIPAMINGRTGQVVKPRALEFYYHIAPNSRFLTQPTPGEYEHATCPPPPDIACPEYAPHPRMPRGLTAIAGINPSTGVARSGTTMTWRCNNILGAFKVGPPASSTFIYDPANTSAGMGLCTTSDDGNSSNTYMLTAVITFQVCWDGATLNTTDVSHLDGQHNPGIGVTLCHAAHPYLIPEVTAFISYDHSGPDDFKDWYLSSDRHNGATWRLGETMHADAYWAWDDSVMNTISTYIWSNNGVEQHRTTNNGVLGDGTRLTEDHVSTAFLSSANRYVDLPYRGGSKGRIRSRVR
jgi:hypothetical protein